MHFKKDFDIDFKSKNPKVISMTSEIIKINFNS